MVRFTSPTIEISSASGSRTAPRPPGSPKPPGPPNRPTRPPGRAGETASTSGLSAAGAAGLSPAVAAVTRSTSAGKPPAKSADRCHQDKIWNLHLTFTAEQWAAMEPKGGGSGGWMFMMGGQRDASGPATARLLAATMLKRGDANRDGKLSLDE